MSIERPIDRPYVQYLGPAAKLPVPLRRRELVVVGVTIMIHLLALTEILYNESVAAFRDTLLIAVVVSVTILLFLAYRWVYARTEDGTARKRREHNAQHEEWVASK
ncbi:hypothetical protein ACT3TB_16410 [Micrococcaceae sp. AOP34-BR2-30]